MNLNQYVIGDELCFSFALNIAGTNSAPSEVRVSLGQNIRVSAIAILNSENQYEVKVPIVQEIVTFKEGTLPEVLLAIEIILNGKIFTPLKKMITINRETVSAYEIPEVPAEVVPEVKIPKILNIEEKKKPTFDFNSIIEEKNPEVKKEEPKEKITIKFDRKTVVKKPPNKVNITDLIPKEESKLKVKVPKKIKEDITNPIFKITKTKIYIK